MPSRSDITYFGPGPAALPTEVIEDAAKALINYGDTGLGIAEHSHRSAIATDIINETKADLASYLDIPDDYEIIFMHGGGSGEFSAVAYNFVGAWVSRKHREIGSSVPELKSAVKNLKMDYIVTGSWSRKAAAEAERLFGSEYVNIVADSRKENSGKFGTIPDESTWNLSQDAALVYYCDNETVEGVEFPRFPKAFEPGLNRPIVVADMSSNILSRTIPIKNFSAIFFGAQKNLGTTGITVVVIHKSFLPPITFQPPATLMRQLGLPIPPRIFEYETIAKNNSLYNTLSIFDVYVAGQVLKRLSRQHSKVQGQQAVAEKKAQLIYRALEVHPSIYQIIPDKTVRSRMNICFRIEGGDPAEEAFLQEAAALGLTGLRGHRDLRGIRASNYNSVPLEGAEKLAKFIGTFASQRETS
ncbi:pyridoxal phosphate-dependent transferase [Durotheca rogersii]|uniref:pyridoxal phosphate-dependent transferase n=1 Tax=Durotheca rogersii TaxID=419775 RepID=UPI00221E8BBC|nr:pyridoxal phosphate-dependent transferase [Durotheca rogersii]KAI5865850.1 pyridoxal phosphate-dependent transferase [Durotheca rogersii]